MAPNGSQNNPAKKKQKTTDSKIPIEKNVNGKNIEKRWRKLKEGSEGPTLVGKTVKNAVS